MTDTESIHLELLSLAALLDTDPAQVRHRAAPLLARAPDNRPLALLLAAAELKLGDAAAALAILEPRAAQEQRSAILQLELGRAYRMAGRPNDALAALRRALELDAALAEGWRMLAEQLFELGDEIGGDEAYLRYSRLVKSPPELSDATRAMAEGRHDAADLILEQYLERSPQASAAWRLRGELALRRQRYADAERYLRRCLELTPGDATARFTLAATLLEMNRSAETLPLLDRLLAVETDAARYLELKAKALRHMTRNEDALDLLRQAVERHPGDASLLLLRGHILREVGRSAEAIDVYRQVTALSPGAGTAWWCLANTKTYRFVEPEIAEMRNLLNTKRVQGAERTHLEFALGKALENSGAYEQSFQHYSTANALFRRTFEYRAHTVERTTSRMCESLTREYFERRKGWGSDRNDPIFIVGMPRSGSTLLEQILASHSQIEGTHELPDMPAIAAGLVYQQNRDGTIRTDPFKELTAESIEMLAAGYLRATAHVRSGTKPRFTDKQLGNFRNIGLIHLLFPRASIIDIRRHPMACAFACYKQHFAHLMPFCYDLQEVARYYRDYVRLMEHIDTVLPTRVYRVYYERLVADPEEQVRSLLKFCGLPFETDCLRFYANERTVRTISSEQVRQPIFRDSLEHWRHYEQWLAPLRSELGELVDNYPCK